ncbi:MAG: UDP-N-acetylglucosamine 1-carboxyvinyltransferase, partial [Clostridia bacterium]|nr:UDP-N-acetylglucosamine 1-carboxyvinyltransferase [Clostridia bacterium]
MQSLIINGGRRLAGTLSVHGAKNSVLPLISATILLNGKSILHNCPDLSDVSAALDIIKSLGLSLVQNGSDIEIISYDTDAFRIPDDLMRRMRSSVMFLG